MVLMSFTQWTDTVVGGGVFIEYPRCKQQTHTHTFRFPTIESDPGYSLSLSLTHIFVVFANKFK